MRIDFSSCIKSQLLSSHETAHSNHLPNTLALLLLPLKTVLLFLCVGACLDMCTMFRRRKRALDPPKTGVKYGCELSGNKT